MREDVSTGDHGMQREHSGRTSDGTGRTRRMEGFERPLPEYDGSQAEQDRRGVREAARDEIYALLGPEHGNRVIARSVVYGWRDSGTELPGQERRLRGIQGVRRDRVVRGRARRLGAAKLPQDLRTLLT